MNTQIIEESQELVKKEVPALVDQANALVIRDNESYQHAGILLPIIKSMRKKVTETFGETTKKAYIAYKSAKELETRFDAPLVEAETKLKNAMGTWQYEQTMKAEKERRELQEVARKAEEEQKLNIAAALEKEGQTELANTVLEQPVILAPVKSELEPPKVSGVSFRENWKAEVFDLMALVRAVAADLALINLIEPNMQALNGVAKSLKASMNISGVRPIMEKVVSARAF